MAALSQTGASYFEGQTQHGTSAAAETVSAARSRNIKWGMTVESDLNFSDSALVARIKHIAANAADRCLYIEGVNEPNYNRDTGTVPTNWAARTVTKQRIIWQTVKGDYQAVSGQGPRPEAAGGCRHREPLSGPGCSRHRAVHGDRRPARIPVRLVPVSPGEPAARLDQAVLGRQTAWISETGYTNALAAISQGTVRRRATYAPSLLLEALDRGCRGVAVFELLDSPNAAKGDIPGQLRALRHARG